MSCSVWGVELMAGAFRCIDLPRNRENIVLFLPCTHRWVCEWGLAECQWTRETRLNAMETHIGLGCTPKLSLSLSLFVSSSLFCGPASPCAVHFHPFPAGRSLSFPLDADKNTVIYIRKRLAAPPLSTNGY